MILNLTLTNNNEKFIYPKHLQVLEAFQEAHSVWNVSVLYIHAPVYVCVCVCVCVNVCESGTQNQTQHLQVLFLLFS